MLSINMNKGKVSGDMIVVKRSNATRVHARMCTKMCFAGLTEKVSLRTFLMGHPVCRTSEFVVLIRPHLLNDIAVTISGFCFPGFKNWP